MVEYNRLEKEIEHLNSNGSRNVVSKNWPSSGIVDKANEELVNFKKRLSEDKSINDLDSLVPLMEEYLTKIGSLVCKIEVDEPFHFGSDLYGVNVNYNFLGKNVKNVPKFQNNDKDKAEKEIWEDFQYRLKNFKMTSPNDGKVVVYGKADY